jgi:ketosteroid isomerase-like protein
MTTPQPNATESERATAALIETYRQGFLHLAPEQIASIWDQTHEPLIYVAQENNAPTYGWPAIHNYITALPEHVETVQAKDLTDMKIDILGDAAIAFFTSHSTIKLRGRTQLHDTTFRVTMIFHQTPSGWRLIHFHESALSAQAAHAIEKATLPAP